MVGGKVIEVIARPDKEIIWVNCQDNRDECAIYVVMNEMSRKIKPGDSLWWQSDSAMWTPAENRWKNPEGKCGVDFDIRLPRVGFSGVPRPTPDMLAGPFDESTYEGYLASEVVLVYQELDKRDVDRTAGTGSSRNRERLSLWGRVLEFVRQEKGN